MRKAWRIVSLMLLFGAAASVAFAGGGKEATTGTASSSTGTTNEFGWQVPKTTLEFSYYYEQNDPKMVARWSTTIDKFLLDKFNVKLDRLTYDNDPAERLNLMLASSQYPDVLSALSPSQARQWVDLGKTQNMAPSIAQYGKDLTARLGDLTKRFREKNGEVRVLPNLYGILSITDRSPQIRYDWYKEIGSPKITTPDDYYNALKAMVAKHPTNDKGAKTYAFCFIDPKYRPVPVYEMLGSMWGLKKSFKEDAAHNLTFFLNTPEGLALTKYLNQYNRDGLLDPDSFIISQEDWSQQKLGPQRFAGDIDSWWITTGTQDLWPTLIPNYDDKVNRYIHIDVKAAGVDKSTFNPKDASGYYRTVVTDKAKSVADVVKWMNFESTGLGIKLMGWGVPAEFLAPYTTTPSPAWHLANGKWSFDDQAKALMLANKTDYDKLAEMGQGVHAITLFQGFTKEDGTTYWFDQNFNNETWWKQLMNNNMKDSMFDFSAFFAIELPAENPLAPKWQLVQDMVKSEWIRAVMSPTDQGCVDIYNALVQKANDAGLKDVEKFYSDNYKSILQSWQ